MPSNAQRFKFGRSRRLTLAEEFRSVQRRGYRQSQGPLTVIALPNTLGRCRLGLSISRRVGPAVVRNRLKRMLRESFRLEQHGLGDTAGVGYDLVIVARRHTPQDLETYRALVREAVIRLDKAYARRDRRAGGSAS